VEPVLAGDRTAPAVGDAAVVSTLNILCWPARTPVMDSEALDEVDRGILYLLQEDARNNSATDIAELVGVTANTVRNRIRRLEERDVLNGYVPLVDYEQAGFQLEVDMICSAGINERSSMARAAVEVDGVVHVRERMTGQQNVIVTAVAAESDELTAIAGRLDDVGLTVEAEELVKSDYVQPFGRFGVHD
jgi:DNA-binding Lrp family transcriptional regulator